MGMRLFGRLRRRSRVSMRHVVCNAARLRLSLAAIQIAFLFVFTDKYNIMPAPPSGLVQTLTTYNQQHVLKWWDELSDAQQSHLVQQLQAVDLEKIQSVWQSDQAAEQPSDAQHGSRAERAQAPTSVVRQPAGDQDLAIRQAAAKAGEKLLAEGEVAVITVAGGQGSRLGFDQPKGMFPIGPVSDRTLFQIFGEQIQARQQRHGGTIPWLIMTSAATHQDTVKFFEHQAFFGLDRQHVHFFQQGSMPAVAAENGQLLLESKSSLCLSPDGHGGLVAALQSSGLLQRMADQQVDQFFYHQVDNPTVIMCDPELLGLHQQHSSQLTTNVVQKSSPTERMGVLVEIDGDLQIIEYSELTEEQASRSDASGQWIFWAGNTAVHVFERRFLEHLAAEGGRLPLHLAKKKVACLNSDGQRIEPEQPNAHKFERFIFDALPLAQNALIVEGDRDREFNPVKNADGSDSPATSRAALNRIAKSWLAAAGHSSADDAEIEISPLVALDQHELVAKIAAGDVSVEQFVNQTSSP